MSSTYSVTVSVVVNFQAETPEEAVQLFNTMSINPNFVDSEPKGLSAYLKSYEMINADTKAVVIEQTFNQ
jgi:hypothetical protein